MIRLGYILVEKIDHHHKKCCDSGIDWFFVLPLIPGLQLDHSTQILYYSCLIHYQSECQ